MNNKYVCVYKMFTVYRRMDVSSTGGHLIQKANRHFLLDVCPFERSAELLE